MEPIKLSNALPTAPQRPAQPAPADKPQGLPQTTLAPGPHCTPGDKAALSGGIQKASLQLGAIARPAAELVDSAIDSIKDLLGQGGERPELPNFFDEGGHVSTDEFMVAQDTTPAAPATPAPPATPSSSVFDPGSDIGNPRDHAPFVSNDEV